MIKRYFKTFDDEGWIDFMRGLIYALLTFYFLYKVYQAAHIVVLVLSAFVGLELTTYFIGRATIGSIYREREGKNKELYKANKVRVDKRYAILYGKDEYNDEDAD